MNGVGLSDEHEHPVAPNPLAAAWSIASPQRLPVTGGADYPSVRYSASSVMYNGEMIITHGYFYDHGNHHPAWQSNAWAFNIKQQTWRKIHEGERAGSPSARYCSSAVLFEHGLWMFGGDDGGHKTSMNNYIFNAHFDELWRLDLRTYQWRKVEPRSGPRPPKRALHAAVEIMGSMYVYAGLGLADTWRYDFQTKEWTLLLPEPNEADKSHPGKRHAFAAAAMPDGFYVFGGNRHVKGGKPLNFEDLWKYSIAANSWSEVRPVGALPGSRGHHSLLALSPDWLLLYGGALCNPGCKCYGDTWILHTGTGTGTGTAAGAGAGAGAASSWRQLNASDAPIHRYRQSLVLAAAPADPAAREPGHDPQLRELYLFGGESYKPYMYHNAVNRLQLRLPSASGPTHPAAAAAEAAAAAAAAASVEPPTHAGGASGGAKAGASGGASGGVAYGAKAAHKHAEALEVAPRAAYRASRVKPLASPPMEVVPAAEPHELGVLPLVALLACAGLMVARYMRMRQRRRRTVQVPE